LQIDFDTFHSGAQAKAVLDNATQAYWAVVKQKNDQVASLQGNITAAVQFQKEATSYYQYVVTECQ
jgi:hypothetical protein